MLKIRGYLLIAFVVYSVTLLSALPASMLIKPLENKLGNDFQANQVSGTVWKGRVSGQAKGQKFNLTWNLHVLKLLLLRAGADLHLKTNLLEVKANLTLAYKSFEISELTGVIKSKFINDLLVGQGLAAQIESDIYLKKITLKRAAAVFTEADGQISWEGGVVKAENLPDGKMTLPPLLANIGITEPGVSVNVSLDGVKTVSLLDIDLSHDGKAHLKLKERVAEYIEVPTQLKTGNLDSIMFEIKRQIFDTQGEF